MLLSWLRLTRASLAPTIVWDWAAGLLLCGTAWRAGHLTLLAILLAIYHGGMLANDLADRTEDRSFGRARPLADGRIRPTAAAVALFLLWGGAFAVAALAEPDARAATILMIAAAGIYNFAGRITRGAVGPVLLATLRVGSFFFVPITDLGLDTALAADRLAAAAAYALYFMFLSRLARGEEQGVPGAYGFALTLLTAAAPLALLVHRPVSWLAAIGWLAFAALVVAPALRDARARAWPAERVRAAVRRGLGTAPLVPALALLALPHPATPAWALGGVAAMLAVRALARVIPPE
jgi:hypothetical protein